MESALSGLASGLNLIRDAEVKLMVSEQGAQIQGHGQLGVLIGEFPLLGPCLFQNLTVFACTGRCPGTAMGDISERIVHY